MTKNNRGRSKDAQAAEREKSEKASASEYGAEGRVSALSALYQGEKTDASSVFNTAMVMMGAAVAYLLGAVPLLSSLSHGPFPWLFLSLLPFPLWLVMAFHSLITLNAMSHGISVQIIENELFGASGLKARNVKRKLVGSAASDKIMDITQANPAHKVTSYVVYGGVGVLIVGFTIYALYAAIEVVRDDPVFAHALVVYVAVGGYPILLLLVIFSWIKGLRVINAGRADIPNSFDSDGTPTLTK